MAKTPTTSRALHLAILPIASSVLALSGCGGPGAGFSLGNPREDPVALQKVEETISRVRGTGTGNGLASADVQSRSAAYASSVDAAINAQPQLATKIEQLKATGQVTPTTRPATTQEIKQPLIAPGEAKIETKTVAPQVLLASQDGAPAAAKTETKPEAKAPAKPEPAAPAKAEPVVETKAPEKVEPRVEPKIEVKAEAKPEVKTEPKLASAAPPAEPKTERTDKPAAAAPAVTEPKVASAMGAMAVAGNAVVTDDPGVSAPAEPAVAMDTIVAQLRKQVQANPRQLNIAMALQLLEGSSTDTKGTISALSEIDQRFVGDISAAIAAVMQQPANATLSEKIAPLATAVHKLEGDGDLQLPRLALASRVDSYGVYTPLDNKFENGKRHTVIIYCEVANFSTRKADDGFFTTKLAQQDSLITEDGLLVWRPNPEEVEDRSRNQRRDFYLVKKLTLPETLAIGKYTLRMSVTDKQTNKISMVSIPVEIVAK